MLEIKDLKARVEDGEEILKGINLTVRPGEVHAIMGPNGSGKSPLSAVIAGNPKFEKTAGSIFLSFQYPVEIPGVSVNNFIRTAINEKRKSLGLPEMPPGELLKFIREKAALVELDPQFLSRSLNEGFSGGEKKRAEIFQMAALQPRLAILDETDSGLDIDALRIVASGVNRLKSPENATIVITHYQRLLDYIVPDYVHVLYKGRIIRTGDKSLALELEERGYDWLIKDEN